MRLVTCPQCGHENRVSVVVTICDRCGEDISSRQPVEEGPPIESEAKGSARPTDASAPTPPARAVDQAGARETRASRRGIPISLVGRVVSAAVAVVIGLIGSQNLPMGTAMVSDSHIAGSVAILAVAAGVSGLVILLVGPGSGQSEALGPPVRLLGFLLACFGTLAAVALVTEGSRALPPVGRVTVPYTGPPLMPMGPPPLDPETGEPMPGFRGFQGFPGGPAGEGSQQPGMPQAPPGGSPPAAGQPPP